MNKVTYSFLLLIFMVSISMKAQKIVKIKQAVGEYTLPAKSDISEKSAYNKAVAEAKLNALRKAGVTENIASSEVVSTNQKGSDFKQDLNSILTVELDGAIYNDSVIQENKSIDEFGNTKYSVTISADVIIYEKKADPAFIFDVEGVKEYYENNDPVKFTFKPYSNGYLKIFNFTENEISLLYPYFDKANSPVNDKTDFQFAADQAYTFPLNNAIDAYYMETKVPREFNYFVFVYTKENIPFRGKMSFKNVLSWIYSISPDKRKVQFLNFVIVNKQAE